LRVRVEYDDFLAVASAMQLVVLPTPPFRLISETIIFAPVLSIILLEHF